MTTTIRRTITLTGRAPVTIGEGAWPTIARAQARDTQQEQQEQQATRRWQLSVRAHADGRAIVYGVCSSSWHWELARRGGELLAPGADLARAIERVGHDIGAPPRAIAACIADLPAEAL